MVTVTAVHSPIMTCPHALHALLVLGLVAGSATGQQDAVARWIDQLATPDAAARAAARDALVAVGAPAVAPLAKCLATADDDTTIAVLDVLRELAPVAGEAIGAVRQRMQAMRRRRGTDPVPPMALPLLTTLAELIAHRGPDDEVNDRDLVRFYVDFELHGGAFTAMLNRLRHRQRFPLTVGLPELRRVAASRSALHAEVAIERLGRLGAAAQAAVPELRAVLDRPEPRVLSTGDALPLHRKAARALLAIAPQAPEAVAARAVLAGTWQPPERPQPVVPERARARLAELGAVLRDERGATRRAAALENLVALGALAAPIFASLLEPDTPEVAIQDALTGLRRLGRHGADAVPALVEALRSLPAPHTIDVLRALGTTAPWATDLYQMGDYTTRVGKLTIDGHRIKGTIDIAFINAFSVAFNDVQHALDIPVDATADSLRDLLADPVVGRRRRALEVIAARGSECSALLDVLVAMLSAAQPVEHVHEWIDAGSARMAKVDRSDAIQRLAASTILAVAPNGHAAIAAARDRLAHPEAK